MEAMHPMLVKEELSSMYQGHVLVGQVEGPTGCLSYTPGEKIGLH